MTISATEDHAVRRSGSLASISDRTVLRATSPPRVLAVSAAPGPRVSRGDPLHLVMDTYGTHKQPKVQAWLERHPRFVCHFVPTSSGWLNLVERWFPELTKKRIRRGSFGSVEDLKKAIEEFRGAWNERPKRFVRTATVESIVEKLSRCRQTLEKIQPGCTLPRRRKAKH